MNRYAASPNTPIKIRKFRNTEKDTAPPPIMIPTSIIMREVISAIRSEKGRFPSVISRDTTAPEATPEKITVKRAKRGILPVTSRNIIASAPKITANIKIEAAEISVPKRSFESALIFPFL